MIEIRYCGFDELTKDEREVPSSGWGDEYTTYLRITHNGETVLLESDAIEQEDAVFSRDLAWIEGACKKCYELGREDERRRKI